MKDDIFDDIAAYVPEAHRQAYWRMVAYFRQLKPEDEILNIIFAMGILTFILRELPAGMIEERKAWQGYFKAFREEADRIREGSNRNMVTISNHVEAVGKALEMSGAQFMERTARIEIASREAVNRIDVEGMAQRLTARVEARVLTRFDALATTMEKRYQLMEKIGEQVSRLIERLQQIHMGRMIAAISAVVFVLCGVVFLAAYWHLKDTDNAVLNDKLAQVEQMATANREAFAALAVNNVRVEVTDLIIDGQKQVGQKALRITPSLGVMEEAPPDMEKSGLIRFAVPETFQDQIELNQKEIDRLLRQFRNSK